MGILRYELEKIFKSKILWVLVGIFVISNISVIVRDSYNKNDLKILNNIIDTVGMELDNNGEKRLEDYYKMERSKVDELIYSKTGKKKIELDEFYSGKVNRSLFSNDELEKIYEVNVLEVYYVTFKNGIERYSNINVVDKAKENLKRLSSASEKSKERYINAFEKFNERLNEIRATDENRGFHINGGYFMHKMLFNDTLKKIGVQGVIIILMLTAFIYNYEFENKTSYLVYSTKEGRRDKNKLKASLIGGGVFLTIILVVTLGIFFIIYDYSRVFNSLINSVFNWESIYPQLSWINVTVREFLMINIGLIYAIGTMIIFIISYISKITKNTYITFFIGVIIYGGLYLLPDILNKSLILQGISTYNPIMILEGISFSFSMFSTVFPNKYFEVITIITWSIFIYIGYGISDRRFKREDI
ncbi:hypothetical protein [uncultured Clostridium sp.]|uniref:hypothetical protein n=1 Tax=uncultured Clostridium sp. TaxID=59620 RepID=UPI00261F4CCF|nr:hypothetical protein [uncultured Clostridium sp.]